MIQKELSIILYLSIFITSCFFFKVADKNKNKSIKFKMFSFFGIMIFAVFASLRDDTIGTDVLVYAKPLYLSALNISNPLIYIQSHPTIEPLFSLLVFGATKITGSIGGVLFFITAFQIVPIYLVATEYWNDIAIDKFMFLYYCLFSLLGFTLMRQMIAVGFLLLAYTRFTKNQVLRGVVCCSVALLFHSSSFVGIVFIILFFYINNNKSENKRKIISALVLFIMIFVIVNLSSIFTMAVEVLGLSNKYSIYIDAFNGVNNKLSDSLLIDDFLRGIIFLSAKIMLLMIPLLTFKNREIDHRRYPPKIIFLMVGILYVIFVIFLKTIYIERLTIYAEYYLLLTIGLLYKKHRDNRDMLIKISSKNAIINVIAITYFVVVYEFIGVSQVFPYVFR